MVSNRSIFDAINKENDSSDEEEQTFFQKLTGCFKQKKQVPEDKYKEVEMTIPAATQVDPVETDEDQEENDSEHI